MRRILIGLLVLGAVACGREASKPAAPLALAAVSDPRTLPRADLSGVVAAGSFSYDWPDGAGGDLSYGADALGVSEDGRFLYVSCTVGGTQRGIAKLEIPALGAMAKVVAPCQGPTYADLVKLLPAADGGSARIGGVVEYAGGVCVTGYWTYDASGATQASHWCGPTLTTLRGPFRGSVAPGLVKSQMFVVPAEWRATLGGPVASTAGYTSIISRASYGAAVSVFDPATVTANGFPMALLLGCPHSVASCITYGTPTSNDYNGSELSGGAFIVPGTRTLVAVEREASGPTCYGYATRVQADHGKPTLDAVWCYSLSDPLNQKGPKGYPYRLVAKLYDLADLAAVKAGTKQPWDIRQYATVDLPGSSAGENIQSGVFNPVRGEYYLSRGTGGGANTIYVYRGFNAAAPPPPPGPVDCVPGVESMVSDDSATAACVGGLKHVTETWTRTGDVPASNGGAACVPVVSPRFRDDPCSLPPVDPCVAAPLVASVTSWPGSGEGGRSGGWSWSVAGSVETLIKATWAYSAGRAVTLDLTDSRGCSARVVRP